jgi:hypothetical protein
LARSILKTMEEVLFPDMAMFWNLLAI